MNLQSEIQKKQKILCPEGAREIEHQRQHAWTDTKRSQHNGEHKAPEYNWTIPIYREYWLHILDTWVCWVGWSSTFSFQVQSQWIVSNVEVLGYSLRGMISP